MNKSPRPTFLVCAALGCCLGLAVTAPRASDNDANGNNPVPAGDKPGRYWACAASVNGVQHDSAIFLNPNLFPQQINWEYSNYLSLKYQGGMPTCEWRPTRAEAENFLSQHAAGTIPDATSKATRRVATGWMPHQLGGPPIVEPKAAPPPLAPRPQGPTSFYACKSFKASENTEYTSAAFLAGVQQSAAIEKAFDAYLIGMFGHQGVVECPHFATLAEANAWINARRMAAIREHFAIETTHWKVDGAYDETSVATTAAPQPPNPVTPPPPKPVVAVAAPKPPAAAKGIFVTCNSNSFTDRARYYNPPVSVTGGDYTAWMACTRNTFRPASSTAAESAATSRRRLPKRKATSRKSRHRSTHDQGQPRSALAGRRYELEISIER